MLVGNFNNVKTSFQPKMMTKKRKKFNQYVTEHFQ